MMKNDILHYVLIFFLVCCGLYGTYFSIQLLFLPNDMSNLRQGYYIRGVPLTYENFTQVVIVTKEDSLGGTVTLMNSIVQNTETPVYFFIVTDNDTLEHLWTWIERTKLKSIPYEIKGLKAEWIKKRINKEGTVRELLLYSPLFLAEIFPNLKRRFILLDDDTLALADISELNRVKLLDHQIGAFSSDCDNLFKNFNYKENKYGQLMNKEDLLKKGINPSACTFSLGVAVVDSERWKSNGVTEEVVKLMEIDSKENLFKEHGLLSPMLVALYNKTKDLDSMWHIRNIGLTTGSRYHRSFLTQANLLHWSGPFKPWRKNSPFTDIWDKYYVPDPTGKFSLPGKKSILKPSAL